MPSTATRTRGRGGARGRAGTAQHTQALEVQQNLTLHRGTTQNSTARRLQQCIPPLRKANIKSAALQKRQQMKASSTQCSIFYIILSPFVPSFSAVDFAALLYVRRVALLLLQLPNQLLIQNNCLSFSPPTPLLPSPPLRSRRGIQLDGISICRR